jgi:hypothetical protein
MLKLLQKIFAPDELETMGQPAPRPLNPDKPANKKQRRGAMNYRSNRRFGTKLHGGGAR